ncbi:MAG: hypothetical protein OXL37_04405 [Chloroflexota bacterium]|nr:hypothetical protein [Chloroflexota bacterium]MDE2960952.1 hypothetical protein [Chloroflexota bacterium]
MSTDSKIPGVEIPYAEQERRAHVIYEAKIRPKMTPSDEDKYVLIDILTGDYEIGENEAVLTRLLRERRPEAVMHCIHRHQSRFGRVRSPHRLRKTEESR